jgi:hypothetical protein
MSDWMHFELRSFLNEMVATHRDSDFTFIDAKNNKCTARELLPHLTDEQLDYPMGFECGGDEDGAHFFHLFWDGSLIFSIHANPERKGWGQHLQRPALKMHYFLPIDGGRNLDPLCHAYTEPNNISVRMTDAPVEARLCKACSNIVRLGKAAA